MTREEAIVLLNQYNLYSPTKQIEEALDMAIEALQTLEAVERIKTEVLPQTDLVRCKDCRYYHTEVGEDECRWRTDESPNDDDFCSYGERAEQTEYKMPGHDEVMEALDKLTLRGGKDV